MTQNGSGQVQAVSALQRAVFNAPAVGLGAVLGAEAVPAIAEALGVATGPWGIVGTFVAPMLLMPLGAQCREKLENPSSAGLSFWAKYLLNVGARIG